MDNKIKLCLNIGCGLEHIKSTNKMKWINIDVDERVNPDLVRDVEKGLPFNNEMIDEIRCFHILEHVKDLIFVMNEFWRVLKVGGQLIIESPHISGMYAWIDPDHCRFFNEHSFDFFINPDFNSLSSGVYGFYKLITVKPSEGFISLTLMKESHEETITFLPDKVNKVAVKNYLNNVRNHFKYE